MIAPGSTIGVLGSGQLGRMFAAAAQRLGYRVHVYSPETDTPAGQVAQREIVDSYRDDDALKSFASSVDVVTLEFENIPLATVNALEQWTRVAPGPHVLEVTRNRLLEKSFLTNAGLPVVRHAAVSGPEQLQTFQRDHINGSVVLKSAEDGYDGKGQTIVSNASEATEAFDRIGTTHAVVEERVDLACELSVVGSRADSGEIECFGPMVNHHHNHILDVSVTASTEVDASIQADAVTLTRTVLEQLNVVGVLTVEFFYTSSGQLLINELAPRPHNSGHLSIEASVTSQFEQQVRAVCGLPLGSMALLHPAAMANLLGDHLTDGAGDWQTLLAGSDAKLHLYGKAESRIGRKMGHLTTTAATAAEAESDVRKARGLLQSSGPGDSPADPQQLLSTKP